jgi:N-acetylmuramoyl-L-alanine amidase
MIVLHYTGMRSGPEALQRLCDPSAKVSAHYLLEEDGELFRLVPEERRAWHAGVSFWRGERDVNGASIGVELVNPGHDHDLRPYPEVQIARLIALLDEIRTRWTVADEDIVGHSDVAPDRKIDPGELFPWDRLNAAGHGLFAAPSPRAAAARLGAPLGLGAEGVDVFALQAGLSRLGFDLPPDGRFDAATASAVSAFQRHWRPTRFDGRADGETRLILMTLLRSLPKGAAAAS